MLVATTHVGEFKCPVIPSATLLENILEIRLFNRVIHSEIIRARLLF